jgi:site-specific DNA-methyltransferase (adenine-specific)
MYDRQRVYVCFVPIKALSTEPEFSIYHGDCVQGMKQIATQSVDVVVTSPPYNLDKEYSSYDDNKPEAKYLEWCESWALELRRILKPDGSFFLNFSDASDNPFFAFEVAISMKRLFQLQNTIHWIKSISIERDGETNSFGHFKPINSRRYLNDCHEYVFHFTQEGKTKLDRLAIGVPYADKSNIKRWSHTDGKDKRCRGNTWFIPYKTIHQRAKQRPHPATFPTELAVKCIRLHGKRDALVVDPFLGIGHSAYAAKECPTLVSQFIGFDIDEEYIRVACEVLGCGYSPVNQADQSNLSAKDR